MPVVAEDNTTVLVNLNLHNCAVEFNEDPLRPEGLSGVTLDCVDPSRDGETMTLVGITFTLKAA